MRSCVQMAAIVGLSILFFVVPVLSAEHPAKPSDSSHEEAAHPPAADGAHHASATDGGHADAAADHGHGDAAAGHGHGHPNLGEILPLWSCIPFACMLLSIAFFPLLAPDIWHHHFGKISAFWAATMAIPFLVAYRGVALYEIAHIILADDDDEKEHSHCRG